MKDEKIGIIAALALLVIAASAFGGEAMKCESR